MHYERIGAVRKHTGRFIFIFFGGLVLYFFAAPVPVGKELLLHPVWAVPLSVPIDDAAAPVTDRTGASGADGQAIGVKTEGMTGFVTPDGRLLSSEAIPYGTALGEAAYITYPQIPERLELKNPAGGMICEISESAYPFIQSGRIFLIEPNRSGISEWNDRGERLWKKRFVTIITDIAVSDASCLLGLMNGTAVMLGPDGEELATFGPGTGRLRAVYGVALSQDAGTVALVSGADPQQLLVYSKRKDRYRQVLARNLDSDFRRHVRLSFSSGGTFLMYETPSGASILDLSDMKSVPVSLPGQAFGVVPIFDDGYFVLSASPKASGSVSGGDAVYAGAFFPPDNRFLEFTETDGVPYLVQRGQSLFLGIKGTALRIDMGEG
jgi:hypothetical protein